MNKTSSVLVATKKSRIARKGAPLRSKSVMVGAPLPINLGDFVTAYRSDAVERIRLVRQGIPASAVDVLAKRMAMPKERLVVTLGLARATVDRKVRENKTLSKDDSSRLLGMTRLVGQVQAMVEESGDPAGFNAAKWVAHWLDQPLAALGGQRPGELMDTPDGQGLVSGLVARMQSGAYA